MQAIGSDEERQILFLAPSTGLGSAIIVDGLVEQVELVRSPYKQDKRFEDRHRRPDQARKGKHSRRLSRVLK